MANLLFGFVGRINRAKFWLVALGIFVVEALLFGAMGGATMFSSQSKSGLAAVGPAAGVMLAIVLIVGVWINIAVGVKRYHDRNKSGWWFLVNFVPVIGGLWYLIECGFQSGTPGPNKYGPDPLSRL